jgi:hypothetical protein
MTQLLPPPLLALALVQTAALHQMVTAVVANSNSSNGDQDLKARWPRSRSKLWSICAIKQCGRGGMQQQQQGRCSRARTSRNILGGRERWRQ